MARIGRHRWWIALLTVVALGVLAIRWQVPFPYAGWVYQEADRMGVDPYLIAAVIRVESRYRPDAVSRRGAMGLMQLMPDTARWIAGQPHAPLAPGQAINLGDPRTNIALGGWYLAYLLRRYRGDVVLALAAYNSGPATVDRWIRMGRLTPGSVDWQAVPYPETRAFVARVLWYRRWYRWVYGWGGIGHTVAGGGAMAKWMSEDTKLKLGERLGVADLVREHGWGAVPARQCGNLVREAVRLAEERLLQR